MKKIYLFISTFLFGLNLLGQIPNASFETWGQNAWSNPQPQGWTVMQTPVNCTSQYTTAYQGSSAFEFENFYWSGQWVDLNASTASSVTNYYVPIGPKPTKLFGWYIFSGGINDGMYVNVTVKSGGSIIGSGSFSTNTSSSVYTQFSVNINYSSIATPDSFKISLGLKGQCTYNNMSFGCGPSYFVIDDLNFDISVGLHETEMNNQIKIYPNPTSNYVMFQSIDNNSQISSIEIFDIKGQIIKKYFVNEKVFELNVQSFDSGLYFYKIISSDGKNRTEKFLKL